MDKIEIIYNVPEETVRTTMALLATLKYLMQGPLGMGFGSEKEIKLKYELNKTLKAYAALTGKEMPENFQDMVAEIKKSNPDGTK